MEPNSAAPSEIRTRIVEAAEQLYAANGRERLPSVSEVRGIARTDMNITAIVVREWKRQQSARPAPVAVPVPEPVQQAMNEALAFIWTKAEELANASLRSAEQQWLVEREEFASDLAEVSAEVERLDANEKNTQERLTEASLSLRDAQEKIEQQADELMDLRALLARQEGLTKQAEARAQEIERRADDLQRELAIAHEQATAVRTELAEARRIHAVELTEFKDTAAGQCEKLNEALASTKGRLDTTTELLETRMAELLELRSQLAAVQGDLRASSEQLQHARLQFETAKNDKESAEQLAVAAGQRAANLEGRNSVLEEQAAALIARFGDPKS